MKVPRSEAVRLAWKKVINRNEDLNSAQVESWSNFLDLMNCYARGRQEELLKIGAICLCLQESGNLNSPSLMEIQAAFLIRFVEEVRRIEGGE
jgi:hypothetical protein